MASFQSAAALDRPQVLAGLCLQHLKGTCWLLAILLYIIGAPEVPGTKQLLRKHMLNEKINIDLGLKFN